MQRRAKASRNERDTGKIANRSIIDALSQKSHVMTAVMLRDVRTRFFNHGLGFLFQSLWPLAHILIVLTISIQAGRAAEYGTSSIIFFSTGLIPSLLFIYISRFMALSLTINKNMLAFPIVKITDILYARAFLEVISGVITIVMLFIILCIIGENPLPVDILSAIMAYMATILLALGIGTIAGLLSLAWPFFLTVFILLGVVFYLTSGALFVLSNLPESIAILLSYNPLVQCVEWMRSAYYSNYSDKYLDRFYVLMFGAVALCAGLLFERLVRGKLLES